MVTSSTIARGEGGIGTLQDTIAIHFCDQLHLYACDRFAGQLKSKIITQFVDRAKKFRIRKRINSKLNYAIDIAIATITTTTTNGHICLI